jgi:putative transcriptional regulator
VATDSALGVAQVAGDDEPLGFRTMFTHTDGAAQPVNVPAQAAAAAATGSTNARTGLIDLDTPTELLSGALTSLRIFAGYAGWAAGQLEQELADGGWALVDSLDGDLQATDAEVLWQAVLRRQGGNLAMLSTYRGDPGLN